MRQEKPPSVAPKEVVLDPTPVQTGGDHVMEFTVEFEHLTFTLPNGTKIMRGVSGRFDPCTSTAIMGASGAGKTTRYGQFVHVLKRQSPHVSLEMCGPPSMSGALGRVDYLVVAVRARGGILSVCRRLIWDAARTVF